MPCLSTLSSEYGVLTPRNLTRQIGSKNCFFRNFCMLGGPGLSLCYVKVGMAVLVAFSGMFPCSCVLMMCITGVVLVSAASTMKRGRTFSIGGVSAVDFVMRERPSAA